MTRVDAHRPSAIDPADYDFVACEYLKVEDIGNAQFLDAERARIWAHMARTGGTYSAHQHGGNCHICGAAAIYTALFYHRPSNTYIRTGFECADKLDCREVELFRKQVRAALEQRAGKRKAEAVLEKAGLAAAWSIYLTKLDGNREENIVRDIVARLARFGSLSEAQFAYLRQLTDQIARRPEIEAQRAAEHDAAKPVPTTEKRIMVRGEVLAVRVPDYDRGDCGPARITVRAEDGWKVWGSKPKGIEVKRGDLIEFNAAVQVSDRDPKFGFFKRPTKARVIVG